MIGLKPWQWLCHSASEAIVTADDIRHGKPDPEIFCKAADYLGAERGELIVCEDALSGVRAAKAAGIRCLAVGNASRATELLQAGADRVVADFARMSVAELETILA